MIMMIMMMVLLVSVSKSNLFGRWLLSYLPSSFKVIISTIANLYDKGCDILGGPGPLDIHSSYALWGMFNYQKSLGVGGGSTTLRAWGPGPLESPSSFCFKITNLWRRPTTVREDLALLTPSPLVTPSIICFKIRSSWEWGFRGYLALLTSSRVTPSSVCLRIKSSWRRVTTSGGMAFLTPKVYGGTWPFRHPL